MDAAASLAPWLALAGLGVLHGLNPLCGWPCALARGLRVLPAIALGHGVSLLAVAAVFSLQLATSALPLQLPAAALLVVLAVLHRTGRAGTARAGTAGLALWSFIASSAHGAGMMLVPALVPLCVAATPAREITAGGSWPLVLAAVAVHAGSMFAAAGAMVLATRRAGRLFRKPWRSAGVAPSPR